MARKGWAPRGGVSQLCGTGTAPTWRPRELWKATRSAATHSSIKQRRQLQGWHKHLAPHTPGPLPHRLHGYHVRPARRRQLPLHAVAPQCQATGLPRVRLVRHHRAAEHPLPLVRWLHDNTVLLAGVPEVALGVAQADLPAHLEHDFRAEAERNGRRLRRGRRQGPPQVHLCAPDAAQLGRLPGDAAQAHALEHPPAGTAHRAQLPSVVRLSPPILRQGYPHRAPHVRHRQRRARCGRHPAARGALPAHGRDRHGRHHHSVRRGQPGDAGRGRLAEQDLVGRARRLARRPRALCRRRPHGLQADIDDRTRGRLRVSGPGHAGPRPH